MTKRNLIRSVFVCLIIAGGLLVFVLADNGSDDMVAVEVLTVVGDSLYGTPAVILLDREADRVLPIWIGEAEAFSISMELADIVPLRPMTHDLLKDILDELEVSYIKVEVDAIVNGTYFASIFLEKKEDDDAWKIDARPSDAIALALRFKAPLYVKKNILDEHAFSLDAHKKTKSRVKKS